MYDILIDQTFQWISSIVVTAIISVYLAVRYSGRKKILFEVGSIFPITHKSLASFSNLDIRVNGENLIDEGSEVLFVEFYLDNVGNRDIRFLKKDGQFLKLILDDDFELIDVNDNSPIKKMSIDNNSVEINLKSFKVGQSISILAIIKYDYDPEEEEVEEIVKKIQEGVTFKHDINDVKNISVESDRNALFQAIFLVGIGVLFFVTGLGMLINSIPYNGGQAESYIGSLSLIIMSFFMIRAYFRNRIQVRRFHKKQN